MVTRPPFPFSAVVGQEEAKLALLLNAVDPSVGGVLLRGPTGVGKSTLVRALPRLLGSRAPLVEVPPGTPVDRLSGAGDDGGLLAAAHGGVLHLDDVSAHPDGIVELVLDVAAAGPSRFVLVVSMGTDGSINPGGPRLAARLLDRIGLAVDTQGPSDPGHRADAVTRRLLYEADAARLAATWQAADEELAIKLGDARPASVPAELVRMVGTVCIRMGADGLRADLTICRAAAALAGWERRRLAGVVDVRRVAPLALAHRCRWGYDGPGLDLDLLDRVIEESASAVPPASISNAAPVPPSRPERVLVDEEPATVTMAVPAAAPVDHRTGNLVVLAVDASAASGTDDRIDAVRSTVESVLQKGPRHRDLVALVTFRGFAAEVVLRPTSSLEIARARMGRLPTGGKTPLAEGIAAALRIATLPGRAATHRPLLVLVFGGRATHAADGSDPAASAVAAARQVKAKGVSAVVVEAEAGASDKASLGVRLAEAMGGTHAVVPKMAADELSALVLQAMTMFDGSQ